MSSNHTQAVSYESFLSRKTLCLKYCVEFSCRRHLKKRNQAAFLHIYKNKDEMNFPPPVRKSSTSTYQWNSMRVTQLNVFVTSLFSRENPPNSFLNQIWYACRVFELSLSMRLKSLRVWFLNRMFYQTRELIRRRSASRLDNTVRGRMWGDVNNLSEIRLQREL